MTILGKFNKYDTYTIFSPNERTRATFIPERGGVGSSIIMPFKDTEREILFLHDYFCKKNDLDLEGGWPFIFPVCARIGRDGIKGNYFYDGRIYNLPIHGFSAYRPWEVLNDHSSSDVLTMQLRYDDKTLSVYPFKFLVKLTYQVSNEIITCIQHYENLGNTPMPYYAGFHPYFLTPPANDGKEQVMVQFHSIRRLQYNEPMTGLIGEKGSLVLPASVNDPEINEQLSELCDDKTIILTYPDGFKLNMCAEGVHDKNMFKYLQIYTQPELPFICLEPWMSFANAMNTVSGVRWINPGESETGILKLWM